MVSSLSAASSVVSVAKGSSLSPQRHIRGGNVSFRLSLKSKVLLATYKGSRSKWNQSAVPKAQLNEVPVDGSSNASATPATKSEAPLKELKEVKAESSPSLSEASISEFMTQVASLAKLVDSLDIVELQMKQPDCELIIRKKEALPQPPSEPPVVSMQSSAPAKQPRYISEEPTPSPPPLTAPTPKAVKSSLPPLKCPMAGTLYKSPSPGEPPFVKVGDQVKKGQVLCIIEAMKLMNEIEADQSGKIVEILVEDGKPVSVDTPLFIIEP
ncbi:biotin carboxyl carrier protein of acetyl-CoA carboxylase 1, chloroplastic-like [Aristolochia californica]|uniref:biotin carboxyl carrier protein of acetyl-CoA carboxylase 1, chloroplastic-like n=1 Tax=Aristolochia californica TaxID=171875 RepID=UPI0035D93D69